mgnify:CR=1 FL=1
MTQKEIASLLRKLADKLEAPVPKELHGLSMRIHVPASLPDDPRPDGASVEVRRFNDLSSTWQHDRDMEIGNVWE